MKSKFHKLLPILLIFLTFGFCDANHTPEKDLLITKTIVDGLEMEQYAPRKIDDSLAASMYKEYVRMIDYMKRFLVQSDIDALKQYEFKIDNELISGNLEFFNLSYRIITDRIKEADSYYKEILAKPFDFTRDETLNLDPDSVKFARDKKELKEYWRKNLKYEALTRIVNEMEMQEKASEKKDTVIKKKSFDEIEKDVRDKLMERYKNLFHRLSQLEEADRFADFMNALANSFDPHTGYFPPKEKEDFDISISGSLEGIGALLTQRDEYIRVERVIPGSPSYKQGQLKAGDIILKVAQGDKEPVDVVDMRLDNAVRLIRGPKGTEVRLTVKKPDESIVVIPIIRDVVYREDAFAKSSIIRTDEDNLKLGYIKLPSFYVDFNNRNGRRSSVDMAKEIEKLNREGIDGLILDLRDNGGGSLQDAVDIAGLFITTGPVVQVDGRNKNPIVYDDHDPRQQYGGPLLILVNSNSASASEILTAAMQDYGRAVIVGDSSTFGKGTVQRFYNLDDVVPAIYDKLKPLGSLKITIQKFYRINGGSTQLKGVIPDIILPDIFNYIKVGEKELDNAMPWDKINPVPYQVYPGVDNKLDSLRIKSRARVQNSEIFKLIDQNARRLEKLRRDHIYPLKLADFRKLKDEREKEAKKFDIIGKDTFDIRVSTLKADLKAIDADSTLKIKNQEWHKSMRRDVYIYEASNILRDLIGS